jgi:hypothetical protein
MHDHDNSSQPAAEVRDHDARRRALVAKLWAESTHKKFTTNRGREPLRKNVDAKSAIDLLARTLLESLGCASVQYLPLRPRVDRDKLPQPCQTDREIVIAKGRRTALQSWQNLSPEVQVLFGLVALDEVMETLAFSLNLGTKFLDTLTAGSPSARDKVRNRIARTLKAKLGRKVAFIVVLEETHQGRLHAHGIVQATRDEQSKVDEALRAAGGKWTAAHGEERQLHLTPVWGAHGWWKYVLKRLQHQDDRRADWIGWSLPAKRAAIDLHRQVRRWWVFSRDDLTVRHSMHFYLGDESLAKELELAFSACASMPVA